MRQLLLKVMGKNQLFITIHFFMNRIKLSNI